MSDNETGAGSWWESLSVSQATKTRLKKAVMDAEEGELPHPFPTAERFVEACKYSKHLRPVPHIFFNRGVGPVTVKEIRKALVYKRARELRKK